MLVLMAVLAFREDDKGVAEERERERDNGEYGSLSYLSTSTFQYEISMLGWI